MFLGPSILRRSISKRSLSSLFLFLGSTAVTVTPARAFFSMSTFTTERTGDGLITVSPKNEGDQSALVVITHGLGDTAEGFADVAEVRTTTTTRMRWLVVGLILSLFREDNIESLSSRLSFSLCDMVLNRCSHEKCPM